MSTLEWLAGLLAVINLVTFTVMLLDKRKSQSSREVERIPEGMIFFMAAAGGSLGVYVAMLLLRHKTRKWYFQLGIPLLILQNTATLYLIWQYLYVVV